MDVRWGIIGCGNVTEVKSGPALQAVPGSSLVAVMRRDAARAEDYARRHGVPRWYADAQALVDDPGVNAIYVATPPASHRDYALMAIAAGKPVYVEKPMARDAVECRQMLAASQARGVPLWVAYYRRALPRFQQVRALLEAGAIGAPRQVRVRQLRPLQAQYQAAELPWRVRPEISGGGLFVDLGSHTLDLLDHLLGPLHDVAGTAWSRSGAYPAEDTVHMRFACTDPRGGGRIDGAGEWCFCADTQADEVVISGDAGVLRFAAFADDPVVLEDARGRHAWVIDNPVHVQQPLLERVVAELQGGPPAPSSGESALRTSQVIDQVLASHRQALAARAGA